MAVKIRRASTEPEVHTNLYHGFLSCLSSFLSQKRCEPNFLQRINPKMHAGKYVNIFAEFTLDIRL